MRGLRLTLLCGLLGAWSCALLAAPARGEETWIGADAVTVAPIGSWRDTVSMGFGAAGRLEIPLSQSTAVLGLIGAWYHPSREVVVPARGTLTTSLWEVPVVLGIRRTIWHAAPPWRVYAEGQSGILFSRARVQAGQQQDTDTDTQLALRLGLGVAVKGVDLGVSVWIPDVSDLDAAMGVLVSVGLRLAPL